jgi:hypothetical protein
MADQGDTPHESYQESISDLVQHSELWSNFSLKGRPATGLINLSCTHADMHQ